MSLLRVKATIRRYSGDSKSLWDSVKVGILVVGLHNNDIEFCFITQLHFQIYNLPMSGHLLYA